MGLLNKSYSAWEKVKVKELNPSDVYEFFQESSMNIYHLDRHVFDIDEKIPEGIDDTIKFSIELGIVCLENWLEEFENLKWKKFYFTLPQLIVSDNWVKKGQAKNFGFHNITPPQLSVMIYKEKNDYTEAINDFPTFAEKSSWSSFPVKNFTVPNLLISRVRASGVWGDEWDVDKWIIHSKDSVNEDIRLHFS